MTVIDNRSIEPITTDALPDLGTAAEHPVRLRQLVAARRGWFMVLAPGTGIDRPLAGAAIWDPARPVGRHQLLLVTASHPAADEIEAALASAGRAEAAAVVVRSECLPREFDITAAAVRAGVPVLAVADRVSWEEAGTLARSLVSASRLGVHHVTPTAGGLYELAEGAALALGGSVVVTDAGLRLLAFACADVVDELTSETILARRVPQALWDRLVHAGTRQYSQRPDRPVVNGPSAAPILVNGMVAGHVVLTPGPDTPECAARVLDDVAAAAAAWFIDEFAQSDDEDAVRAELLRGLLSGAGSLAALTTRLGLPTTERWCLISLRMHGEEDAQATPPGSGITPDIERLLARCARMLMPGTATAVLGMEVYVLMPYSPGSGPRAFVERLRHRAATPVGAPLVACVSHPLVREEDIRVAGGLLRRAVGVLAARSAPSTADLAELRSHLVIAELADLAVEYPALVNGALDALRRDQSARSAEYLDTLLSWFDAGYDVTRAAAALRVHRNTFRYRLQRIEKLCGVDLDDAVQRFTLELQVRLLVLRGGWWGRPVA